MKNIIRKVCLCCLAAVMLSGPFLLSANAAQTGVEQNWPGEQQIIALPGAPEGLYNASGLDVHNGKLYAVDNGTGRLWIMKILPDGTAQMESGYEAGKKVFFADRESAMGPDAEGITVSGDGSIYLASERDNGKPWIAWNAILQVELVQEKDIFQTVKTWDLTEILPRSDLNKGIEAVEWVHGKTVTGILWDQNTGGFFNMDNYPQAVSDGIFFVGLEMNDCIYACVLNLDGTAVLISELDPGLPGLSALDFDEATGILWAAADDRGENRMAKMWFENGELRVEYILPPEDLDKSLNNEGFAIAEERFTANDRRPVYRLADGVFSDALTMMTMDHHIHAFSEEWCFDEDAHWRECACGMRQEEGQHILENVISDRTRKEEAGWMHTAAYGKSCRICGAVDENTLFYDGKALDPEHLTIPLADWIFGIPQM